MNSCEIQSVDTEAYMTSAEEILLSFMHEMKFWEDKFRVLYQEPDGAMKHIDEARADLRIIYEKYLTKKDRNRGKLAAPSAGYPTEFDPDAEKIMNVDLRKPKKIIVETLWTHPQSNDTTQKRRYVLVQGKRGILIDNKEVYRSYSQQWEVCGF